MKNYFAIYGKNALAVYSNGKLAHKNCKYVQCCMLQKYDDFDEAVDNAIYGYNNFQVEEQRLKAVYQKDTLPVNYMLYRKEIEENAFECKGIAD